MALPKIAPFKKAFSNTVFTPRIDAGIPDERKKIARELWHKGKLIEEISKETGLHNIAKTKLLLKSIGISAKLQRVRSHGGGRKTKMTEEEREKRRLRMKQYYEDHPVHQNVWLKKENPNRGTDFMSTIKVSMPEWHEEARKMRKDGIAVVQIAKKFGVSPSRVSQVTSDRWEEYLAKDKMKGMGKAQEAMLSDRVFEKFHSRNPDEARNGVIIKCHSCSETSVFLKHGVIHPVHAAQIFRNRGWTVGGGPRADTCPDCTNKLRSPKSTNAPASVGKYDVAPKEPAVSATPVATPVAAEAVAAPAATTIAAPVKSTDTTTPMTRADKRIVFAKLEDVYLDEVRGYKDEWTDEAVAKDLNIPIQWVAEVRNENFGPNTNAIIAKAAELAGQVRELRKVADGVLTAKSKVEDLLEKLAVATDIFDKKYEDFMEAYKKLNDGEPAKEKPPKAA